jgi:hypothetical protein
LFIQGFFDGGEEYTIVGIGNVQISFGEKTLMLFNVYYVSDMELNLLSVHQILRHGPHLDVNFSYHKCYIVDRETNKTIALGVQDHGLLKLVDTGQVKEHALKAKSASNISTLWHQRYRHLDLTYLSQLAKEKLVDGLPDILQKIQGVCGAFQAGKQHRTLFDEGQAWRAQTVLQLVHADMWTNEHCINHWG